MEPNSATLPQSSQSQPPVPVPTPAIDRASIVQAFTRAPERWLDVGHSKLAYYRFGQGPDVLFVHGWPLNAATFRDVVALLADRFTCHLIDLPGAGQTQTTDLAHVELREHVVSLQRAVDLLGLRRYALLAHDTGGYVARGLAAADPRVAALVLGNTEVPGHTPFLIQLYTLIARLPGGPAIMRAMLKSRWYLRSPVAFGACLEHVDHIDGEFRELIVQRAMSSPHAMQGSAALLRNLDAHYMRELPKVHAQVRAKVRLIWGTADGFFPLAHARRMLPDFSGGADLQEIAGGRLFVHEERPAEFVAHAKPFLLEALTPTPTHAA